jgi:hypothetical protein
MLVVPAAYIRYPHGDGKAYVVDTTEVDQILYRQKESILRLYSDLSDSSHSILLRHAAREHALTMLEQYKPFWVMFEYEYKYTELHNQLTECTIV